ncbi:MAG: MFS transporter [Variovorax sp.]|nr:MFS transporter [Variovorax sp.]
MSPPLRRPAFRSIWIASNVYFLGNAMQAMAAAWTVLAMTGSSFLAALVQTALFLPRFLLSLPAGVLADLTDRRRLIQASLRINAAAALLLFALLMAGAANAGTVLLLIFVIGCCGAMMTPAWSSSTNELVPREELPQAITAMSVAFNAARAIGPTLAGVLYSTVGGVWNHAIAAFSALWMSHASRKHPPRPHPPSRLPPERLWAGMVSALRFAKHSRLVRSQLVRTVTYSTIGSALWALLPVIGQRRLGMDATGYGLLIGCLGAGAVGAGLFIGRLRQRLGPERIVIGATLVFAAAMLVPAFVTSAGLVFLALVPGGAAWMSAMSTFDTATQTSVPPWVRGRTLAMQTVCTLGAIAVGSALWGALSDLVGLSSTLLLASGFMIASLRLARIFPLRLGATQDVTPAARLNALLLEKEPRPDSGPVAVEISYRIDPARTDAFLAAVSALREPRRRDGASFWRVYRDLGDSSRFVERFIVDSWSAYLHQQMRSTLADEALEAAVLDFLREGERVHTAYYLAQAWQPSSA